MNAGRTIQFKDFQLQVSYDFTLPEKRTFDHPGYPGDLKITEVIFRRESAGNLQSVDITDLVMEFAELFDYIEDRINDDFTEKIKDGVFETIAKILKP